jgi:hypothetical protein
LGWAWALGAFTYNKVDFFLAATAGVNSFSREGLYRNGLYAADNASFGKSDVQSFGIGGVKGGATYKLNGRNYLFLNGGYFIDAPTVDNTFVSPRSRNYTVPGVTASRTQSVEGGYLLRSPKAIGRVVGYATEVHDATEVKRFFLDGSGANTFVNFAMQGVNTRNVGLELALEYKVDPTLSVTGVVALNQAFYTNNPRVTILPDNFVDSTGLYNGQPITQNVYIKDYYLGVGPQSAYSLGFNYRSKRYWYANVNFNYFDRNYIDIAPSRRTVETVDLLVPGSRAWHDVVDQEKLPSAFTVDLFAGKSFLLSKFSRQIPRNVFLYVNAGVSNLLDNQNIRTGGFEQARFDNTFLNASKFPPKYFYGFGRNFFVNLSLKF